jgi:hypothetical protein
VNLLHEYESQFRHDNVDILPYDHHRHCGGNTRYMLHLTRFHRHVQHVLSASHQPSSRVVSIASKESIRTHDYAIDGDGEAK